MRLYWAPLCILVACGQADDVPGQAESAETDVEIPTDDDTSDPETPPTAFDCSVPARDPTFVRTHDYVEPSEDFGFDADGFVWGMSIATDGLVRVALDGTTEMFVPNISDVGRGTRILPDGDIVVAIPEEGAIYRVDRSSGALSLLLANLSEPNGIAVGADGFIYATSLDGKITRIDPDNGGGLTLFESERSADGITFGPDFERLYWNSETGEVYTAVVRDGLVVEALSLLATAEIRTGLMDGMTADICGNLYMIESHGTIYKIAEDGTVSVFMEMPSSVYPALNFGSGVGGFPSDHLYVMDLGEGLQEIDVGIPGRTGAYLGARR